jgi:hypothetical protein
LTKQREIAGKEERREEQVEGQQEICKRQVMIYARTI